MLLFTMFAYDSAVNLNNVSYFDAVFKNATLVYACVFLFLMVFWINTYARWCGFLFVVV